MAGYSKKPLSEKLGIKNDTHICILNAPGNYARTLGKLPSGVKSGRTLKAPLDLIHFFSKSRNELVKKFPALKQALASDGTLWISWPKGSAGVATDLNENIVQAIGLDNGLVDVKVCAINDTWSGLKFVYRVKDRSNF